MLTAVAVFASLILIGWLVFRAVRQKSVKAHYVSYGIAIVAAIYTYAYFLSLDLAQLIKVLVSIVLGIFLIFLAALYQRQRTKPS